MQTNEATELVLIRHAPVQSNGLLYGRTDLPADCSDGVKISWLRDALGTPDTVICSPAQRCLQTAEAIWPGQGAAAQTKPALWEQDFGAWEGIAYADLPDLGTLALADLAAHRPPNGESFADLCARIAPEIAQIGADHCGQRVAVVAHAGTIRATLALAMGTVPAALSFEVAPLSITKILALPGGGFSVQGVNQCAE
ncbi:histidine phosphatase family protein [Actibacterium lipolyticum]|uniref:Alpha-ribazole phosphatase n=1 Tax=Actibacterium lipolyticum TaxID=1524263 RepID=A0A238JYU8_9RHOB|nr:histidine phosphatase family protein [Actibacterium lipolyticum]SMX34876.1 Alpha-ribazole phosphatase [Actibacterium lipolyticum]